MTAIEFLNLGGLFKNTRSLVVAAKRCRRIRIKEYVMVMRHIMSIRGLTHNDQRQSR